MIEGVESPSNWEPKVRKDPTKADLEQNEFEAIWKVIKKWDIDSGGCGYHGATGTDVKEIMDSLAEMRRVATIREERYKTPYQHEEDKK